MPMSKSCITCRAVASPELYCAVCQSALYCSKACQREDWKKHKKICKLLNVGHIQLRTGVHEKRLIDVNELYEDSQRSHNEDIKLFFKLFEESTFEGSQAAARKMKKIAKRQTKYNQKCMLCHSLNFLARSESAMLSWPNSPLLVMLQFVDTNVLTGIEDNNVTPLHLLSVVAVPSDYSTHENQLILAKQLIQHGANVKAVSTRNGETPLHRACSSRAVTNLDYVEYLLEVGADPNAQDFFGLTPLMHTTMDAPGAAKFLLNWPTTDITITTRSGMSFLGKVRGVVKYLSDKVALPDNLEQVKHQFLLRQWREVEEMQVKRLLTFIGLDNPGLEERP
jgi:hypothetical protein